MKRGLEREVRLIDLSGNDVEDTPCERCIFASPSALSGELLDWA